MNNGKVPDVETGRRNGNDEVGTEAAETARRECEERFTRLFRSCPVAIGISRLSDGRFIEANDAFCEYTAIIKSD